MATTKQIMERLKSTGHLDFPFGKSRPFTRKLEECSLVDPDVQVSVASYQDFESVNLDALSMIHHGRAAMHDGDVGPATMNLFDTDRCMVPDYGPITAPAYPTAEAIGTGPWKGCHGIGDFHSAIVMVDPANLPSHLKQTYVASGSGTVWMEVMRRTQQAYAEIGLWFIFVDQQGIDLLTGKKVTGAVQTHLTFVRSSDGWIGLAIVGNGSMSCSSSPIWLRLLATYTGGSAIESIVQQWTSLLKHELGHNVGLQHSRGGVMNPSIVNGLQTSWIGDSSETLLKRAFGGVKVPVASPPPGPGPVPPTSGKVWSRPFELLQGDVSLGKFILTPASGA